MKLNSLPSTMVLSSTIVGLTYKRQVFDDMFVIKHSKDVDKYLRQVINNDTLDLQEHFWALYLTNANRVLAFAEITKGTPDSALTNQRMIFQIALLTSAKAIIVAHNHPSGKLSASVEDIRQTKKLKKCAKLFEMNLLDHIIITSESYFSLQDENLI